MWTGEKKRSLAHNRDEIKERQELHTEEDHQFSMAVENLAQQELIVPAADGIH